MKGRLMLFSTLCILFLTSGLKADSSSDSIDYQETIQELDFKRTKTQWVLRSTPELKPPTTPSMSNFALDLDNLMMILGYIVLAIILISIIFFSIKWYKPKGPKVKTIDLENIKDIDEVDLISLLDQALSNKDFRLAFRLKYLSLLQLLSIKKVIKWKPYKTNRNYVVESSKQAYAQDFSQTTRVFEYTWYGLSSINQQQYSAYSSEIDSLNQLIADAE